MSAPRSQPLVVLNASSPAALNGKPVAPSNWAMFTPTITAVQGPGHIRQQASKPVWSGGHWTVPPAPTARPFTGRWVVDDLPDPPSDGFYWLGDASASDGTAGIASAARQWSPHASTSSAPSWRSFFPFKPSVRAHNSWLPSGDVVNHPKGVHFNPHFIEHMWLDFGLVRRQPFTWVIAAMITHFPTQRYRHYLLDGGRNPDAVGFPRLSATDVNTPRRISDAMSYRTLLATTDSRELICTRTNMNSGRTVRAPITAHLRPKMFYGVYSGAQSRVGSWDTGGHRHRSGTVDFSLEQQHRFYVLGRSQNLISQAKASAMLVFEIRYWDSALTDDELEDQFKEMGSTYQFHRYRTL